MFKGGKNNARRFVIILSIFVIAESVLLISSSNAPKKVDNFGAAVNYLEKLPEIRQIENAVKKAGQSKTFYTNEDIVGDVVSISLRESFEDQHTSRIDSFNVNLKTKEILVEDVVSGGTITFDEWKKNLNERFQ